jgi:hypothetical protein
VIRLSGTRANCDRANDEVDATCYGARYRVCVGGVCIGGFDPVAVRSSRVDGNSIDAYVLAGVAVLRRVMRCRVGSFDVVAHPRKMRAK